jgi:hypothetical protein
MEILESLIMIVSDFSQQKASIAIEDSFVAGLILGSLS